MFDTEKYQKNQRNSRLFQASKNPVVSDSQLIINSFGDVKNVTNGEVSFGSAKPTEIRPDFSHEKVNSLTINGEIRLLFVGEIQKTQLETVVQNKLDSNTIKPEWQDVDFEKSAEFEVLLEIAKKSSFFDIATYFPHVLSVRDLDGNIDHCWTGPERGGQTFDIQQLMRDGFVTAIGVHRLLKSLVLDPAARYFDQNGAKDISHTFNIYYGQSKDNPNKVQVYFRYTHKDDSFMKDGEPRPSGGMPLTVTFEAINEDLERFLSSVRRNPQSIVNFIKFIFPPTMSRNELNTPLPADVKVDPAQHKNVPQVFSRSMLPKNMIHQGFRNNPPQELKILPLIEPTAGQVTCLVDNRRYKPYVNDPGYSENHNTMLRASNEGWKYEVNPQNIEVIPL